MRAGAAPRQKIGDARIGERVPDFPNTRARLGVEGQFEGETVRSGQFQNKTSVSSVRSCFFYSDFKQEKAEETETEFT